jgi:hypothetical protein
MINRSDEFYIRVCDCGRIHIESRHFRLSFHPAEFVTLLRRASGIGSLDEDLAAKHHRESAEDRAVARDSGAGAFIHYPFSRESICGASRVD